jgi:hypothetical protein
VYDWRGTPTCSTGGKKDGLKKDIAAFKFGCVLDCIKLPKVAVEVDSSDLKLTVACELVALTQLPVDCSY